MTRIAIRTTGLACLFGLGTLLPAAAQTALTVTHSSATDSHWGVAAQAFKETAEAASGGALSVTIQRLDNEREAIESTQLGTQECALGSSGPLGNFLPETRVFDIPFLFESYEHARSVLDGEIGQDLLAGFDQAGLAGLAWMENGFRNLTTGSRAVDGPADLRGMKIRTMENEVHMRAWEAAGVLPTPMAFSELPSALQQGTVDGQENPISVILANNLDEMQSHLYLTRHVYSPGILLCNLDFVESLDETSRSALTQAAAAAVAANRARVEQDEAQGIETLRERGINIVEIDNRDAYREAMAAANAEFETMFGADMLERIRQWPAQ